MKIDFLYKLLKEKYNVTEATIDGHESDFVIRSNDGQTFTNADFTKSEIDKAKSDLEAENVQKEVAQIAAKEAAQAKLKQLGLTLEDLRALGL